MPDPTNEDRANWAGTAIDAFVAQVYSRPGTEDDSTVLSDLLCNLMHWADQNGINFSFAQFRAEGNYEEEKEEEDEHEDGFDENEI